MPLPRTLAVCSLPLITVGFVALTGCARPEYDLSVVSFPGSQGAELSDDQGRVSTGLEDMVCTADEESGVEDVYVDERTRDLTVVDLKNDGTALVIDVDGTVSVVDPGAWNMDPTAPVRDTDVAPSDRGPDHSGVDDAQFFGDGLALLDGCRLEAPGIALKLPEPCAGASLHEGNGTLLVWHGDQTVYEATPDGLIRWTTAQDLAWDGVNGQFLVLADDAVEGWRSGEARWSTALKVPAIDVFPFQGAVGIRDVEGYLWTLSANGRNPRDLGISIGTDGDVIGSVGDDLIALYTDGLYVLPL